MTTPTLDLGKFVEVRLTVDRMRHSISQMIPGYLDSLEHAIKECVEQACDNAPDVFAAEIDTAIRNTLKSEIERIVRNAVSGSQKIQEAINKEAKKAVEKALSDWQSLYELYGAK